MQNLLQTIFTEFLILGTAGASLYGYSVCRGNIYRTIGEKLQEDCLQKEVRKLVEKYLPSYPGKSPTFP